MNEFRTYSHYHDGTVGSRRVGDVRPAASRQSPGQRSGRIVVQDVAVRDRLVTLFQESSETWWKPASVREVGDRFVPSPRHQTIDTSKRARTARPPVAAQDLRIPVAREVIMPWQPTSPTFDRLMEHAGQQLNINSMKLNDTYVRFHPGFGDERNEGEVSCHQRGAGAGQLYVQLLVQGAPCRRANGLELRGILRHHVRHRRIVASSRPVRVCCGLGCPSSRQNRPCRIRRPRLPADRQAPRSLPGPRRRRSLESRYPQSW